MSLFLTLVFQVFTGRTLFMSYKTGHIGDFCSKNTFYRFLDKVEANWQKFIVDLSSMVVRLFFKPLTSEKREDVFIIDDTLFERKNGKKTELNSKVFDHATHKLTCGFRLLTLGWSDGVSFCPVDFALLASSEDKNVLKEAKEFYPNSIAQKRRNQARRKATEVMFELLEQAIERGHSAKYVLFDSWFSYPKILAKLHEMGLFTIAMIKSGPKVFYEMNGEKLSIDAIHRKTKKRPGRAKYLYEVNVNIVTPDYDPIPAKIICVRNKKKSESKKYRYLITTDVSLTPEDVIRIYGKRWDTEVFYKTCKSLLRLSSECRSLSFDAINAHVAIVLTRYIHLSVEQRRSNDPKSLGEIFYRVYDEVEDLSFAESLLRLFASIQAIEGDDSVDLDKLVRALFSEFLQSLPVYIQEVAKRMKIINL